MTKKVLKKSKQRKTYIQSDLYYPRNSIVRDFWGQILVRPTYMKYSQTSMIRTSIIHGPRLSAVFET